MDELISREAAIRSVNELMEWYLDTFHETALPPIAVIDRLVGLPSAEPRWIPCSERLPDENEGEVFVYLYNPPIPYIAWVRDGHWFTEDFEVEKDYDPDAWMPLPQPYERSEDE